ncbi:MAG: DUF58 domain-containing protein [Candidatus Kariarchaeaceae archaeon]|jgi:uncharacterized protein (DUF58 family)
MEMNEYVLNSSIIAIFSLFLMAIIGDYSWIIASFMIASSTMLKLRQSTIINPKLEISRYVSGRTFQESSQIKVTLDISNKTDGYFRGELADEIPSASYFWKGTNVITIFLRPFEKLKFSYIFSLPRRGKYNIGPIHIRFHSLGENFERTWTEKDLYEIVIVPTPDPVSTYSLPPSLLKSIGGPFRSKLVGEGLDFTGIRKYQPTDAFKKINWKQTAKLRTLHTNEYEINRIADFIIVIDLTEESKDIADASVRSALGLIDYLIHARCKVGLLTLGEYIHLIPPKTGKRHLLEINEHLTNVKSIEQLENLELFQQRLRGTIARYVLQKNEVLLFSSLTRLENALILGELLPELGRITILSPSGTILPTHQNPLLVFSKMVLDLRKNTIRNYMLQKDIRIYEWVPGLPFELSISKWRSR